MNNGPQYRPSNCRPPENIRYCKLLLENLNVDLMLFSVLCAPLDVVQKYLPITAPVEIEYHTFKNLFQIISDGASVCGFPGLPANAIIFPADQSAFSSGELVQYECTEGWVMLGPATRVCQGGTWSGQPPLCSELTIIIS